jgi:hypothetical protein
MLTREQQGREAMFWKAEANQERLPWYRAKNYKGKMSEKQKCSLDAVRLQNKHPAATYADLRPEVQNYISSLEIEVYDAKQQEL